MVAHLVMVVQEVPERAVAVALQVMVDLHLAVLPLVQELAFPTAEAAELPEIVLLMEVPEVLAEDQEVSGVAREHLGRAADILVAPEQILVASVPGLVDPTMEESALPILQVPDPVTVWLQLLAIFHLPL
ncbi:MAG: hypothetical protein WCR20_03055 [Verrucomicrobiota bacterium]